ncbi:MAG: hypothetical protein IPH04_00880 [Saprospirales bacterium]|nr:hypothetical protein [Saprospirales bacterium]
MVVMMRSRQKTFEALFSYGSEQKSLSSMDIPLLVFHNNFLQLQMEKEKAQAVGQAIAI